LSEKLSVIFEAEARFNGHFMGFGCVYKEPKTERTDSLLQYSTMREDSEIADYRVIVEINKCGK
jgi:hypothetical protein